MEQDQVEGLNKVDKKTAKKTVTFFGHDFSSSDEEETRHLLKNNVRF